MARAYLYDVVIDTNGTPTSGASVQVNVHGGGAATLYTTEAGGVTASNPLTTAADGSFNAWVAEGTYDLVISGSGLTTETVYRDLLKGSNEPGAVLTATGDIPYATAANTVGRLSVGSSTTVLHGGTVPTYSPIAIADLSATGSPSATTFLRGDNTWSTPAATAYRKSTSLAVTNTVAETDLLGGGITVGAGVLGTTGVLRLTAWGDWINSATNTVSLPRFKLKLGSVPTTVIDSGAPSAGTNLSASRFGWRMTCEVMNLGATNSQVVNMQFVLGYGGGATSGAFATGEGWYQNFGQLAFAEGVNTSAIDTTAAMAVLLTVINPTANATCETKLFGALAEIV